MTPQERKVFELALEALEQWNTPLYKRATVITSIKEALAQPEQEPVAWSCKNMIVEFWTTDEYQAKRKAEQGYQVSPLYTTPPQRKPLTDEQLIDLWPSLIMHQHTYAFARAIEAAHGIKE